MPVHPQKTPHPAGHHKHRRPGPQTGSADPSKDANGPAGGRSKSKEPVSPLLTAAVIVLTTDILGEIVTTSKIPDVNTLLKNLNDMVAQAGIKTALAEAMLIAQVGAESGEFQTVRAAEDADGIEIYNPNQNVAPAFKQPAPVFGRNATARYLPHRGQPAAWAKSHAEYLKARAAYEKATPGGDFDKSGQWRPTRLTDYLPGDAEVVRWKLLYDVDSPRPSRAQMAKDMHNTAPGDGRKYRGRGFVQLTWKTNFEQAARDLKIADLVDKPDRASEPALAAQIAGWYWKKHGGNRDAVADTPAAFDKVTADINGGTVGASTRRKLFDKAKAAFLKRIPVLPQK